MPVEHYENFPVASILLPRRLRRPVELIYAFARQADDFADEGDLPAAARLELLEGFRQELRRIEDGAAPQTPLFRDLAEIVAAHVLPLQLFHDLLDAFTQDVTRKRYADFAEVMAYCGKSANPVGSLLLHLFREASPQNLAYSDAVCSSLQLINFWQDVAVDYRMGRIYLPQDDMARYGVDGQQIGRADNSGGWQALMLFQIGRTRELLQSGAPLGRLLPGRMGLEIRMIVAGGDAILRKLQACRGDVFHHRPVLQPADWPRMLYRALFTI
jgi:squalene synthase HpnC